MIMSFLRLPHYFFHIKDIPSACNIALFLIKTMSNHYYLISLFCKVHLLSAKNYELDRNQIELHEILGEGQFGDVHRGTVQNKDGHLIPVAVKTCKGDADLATTDKFLEEACK